MCAKDCMVGSNARLQGDPDQSKFYVRLDQPCCYPREVNSIHRCFALKAARVYVFGLRASPVPPIDTTLAGMRNPAVSTILVRH